MLRRWSEMVEVRTDGFGKIIGLPAALHGFLTHCRPSMCLLTT